MVKQYIIERRIMHAIDSLRMNDFHLIKYDCNERAIAHRLAIYIEQIFNGEYSVDCEYNRDGVELKRLYEMFGETTNGLQVYPDIIVHKRGTNSKNILVLELKKRNHVTIQNKQFDQQKLKLFTSTEHGGLGYHYGAYIEFTTGVNHFEKPEIILYSKGAEIQWGSNSLNYMNRWNYACLDESSLQIES